MRTDKPIPSTGRRLSMGRRVVLRHIRWRHWTARIPGEAHVAARTRPGARFKLWRLLREQRASEALDD